MRYERLEIEEFSNLSRSLVTWWTYQIKLGYLYIDWSSPYPRHVIQNTKLHHKVCIVKEGSRARNWSRIMASFSSSSNSGISYVLTKGWRDMLYVWMFGEDYLFKILILTILTCGIRALCFEWIIFPEWRRSWINSHSYVFIWWCENVFRCVWVMCFYYDYHVFRLTLNYVVELYSLMSMHALC